MRGKHVFYPMGWDDNGLPTERRVQNYYGVRCDPTLPYDPDFVPPFEGGDGKSAKAADQHADQPPQLHRAVRAAHRRRREAVRGPVRASSASASTGRRPTARSATRRCSPRSARSCATSSAARPTRRSRPTLWDVTFRTAVAQAELEDREQPGAYHRVVVPPPRRRRDRDRDDPARAHPRLRRPRRAPRRRALPAALRHDRDHPGLRRRGARASPTTSPSRTRAPASR